MEKINSLALNNLNEINKIKPVDLNCSIFSVYDFKGYSMQELICEFVSKLNEIVLKNNNIGNLVEYLVNEGLGIEVAIKLDNWLSDGTLETIINKEVFKSLNDKLDYNKKLIDDFSVNIKDFGCVGDGVTDDTNKFEECLLYCMNNNKKMYIPKGTYIINRTIESSESITSYKANIPVVIQGENATTTKLNTTNNTSPVLSLSQSKNVVIEEIGSDNSWIQPVQYGNVFKKWNMDRTLYVRNVIAFSRDKGFHGYNLLINTPKPSTYEHNPNDSNFYRYPISIQNFSGYNAINIDNYTLDEQGEITNNGDGSSIGIVEYGNSSVGSILQDLTISNKPAHQILSSIENVLKSGIRNNPTYEVDYNGHIAVGCSTQANDTVAQGSGTIKLRDNNPMIRLYNALENNREYRLQVSDGKIMIVVDGEVPLELNNDSVKLGKIDKQVVIKGFDASKGIMWEKESGEKRQIYVDDNGILRQTNYEWCNNGDGDIIQTTKSGTTSERPTLRNNNVNDVGFMYFDTTIQKPIWWRNNVWVDSQGSIV